MEAVEARVCSGLKMWTLTPSWKTRQRKWPIFGIRVHLRYGHLSASRRGWLEL